MRNIFYTFLRERLWIQVYPEVTWPRSRVFSQLFNWIDSLLFDEKYLLYVSEGEALNSGIPWGHVTNVSVIPIEILPFLANPLNVIYYQVSSRQVVLDFGSNGINHHAVFVTRQFRTPLATGHDYFRGFLLPVRRDERGHAQRHRGLPGLRVEWVCGVSSK